MTNLDQGQFCQLMHRVRGGDEAAASLLVRQFEPEIRREIRVRLTDAKLRRTVDSVDICQSVLGTFFVRAALGQFNVERPEQLVGLLVRIARNKIIDRHRQQRRRDTASHRFSAARFHDAGEPADPGPSPSEIASGRELLEQVQGRLTSDERELSQLRSQGKSWREIAAQRGGEPDALRKRLTRACDRIVHELGLED